MKLWLDDVRPMPYDYDIHVKNAKVAIQLLETGLITEVSLDHDLGDVYHDGEPTGTGYDVAKWIEMHAFFSEIPRLRWHVHSANPAGCDSMMVALRNADRFWNLEKK